MDEITMLPDPAERWVMMCPCGASEIRAENGPAWQDFELRRLAPRRYRVTCISCGHVTEHHMCEDARGTAATATT